MARAPPRGHALNMLHEEAIPFAGVRGAQRYGGAQDRAALEAMLDDIRPLGDPPPMSVAVILFVEFVASAAFFIVIPSLYARLVDLEGTAVILGAVITSSFLGMAVMTPLFSRWHGRRGSRGPIVVGLVFLIAGSTWYSFATTWWSLIVSRAVLGLGLGVSFPTTAFISATASEVVRNKRITLLVIVHSLAFTLAPALASSFTTVDIHLSAHVNINDVSMPGLFAAALAACAFFAAFFFREAPVSILKRSNAAMLAPPAITHRAGVYLCWSYSAVISFCQAGLATFVVPIVQSKYKWDVFEVGLLFTYLGVCGVAGAFFGGCLIGIVQDRTLFVVTAAVSALGFFITVPFSVDEFTSEGRLCLGLGLVSLSLALARVKVLTLYTKLVSQVFLDSKVRHYTTATIAGLIAGGVLGGVVLQFGGAFGVLCVGTGVMIWATVTNALAYRVLEPW